MGHTTNLRRALALAGAAILAASLFAGCSSSKKASGKTKGTSATGNTSVSNASSSACQAWIKVDTAANQGPGGSGGPPNPAALKQFATQLKPLVDKFASSAPSATKADAAAIQSIVDSAASGGDTSKLDPSNPALGKPLNGVEKWVHDSCGFQAVSVMGVDYAFEDLPKSLKAGPTSIEFMNHAKDEQHEIGVIRIKPGSGVDAAKLVADIRSDANGAQQKYGDKVEPVAETEAPPGQTAYTTVDLQPGQYVAACFIPVGGKDGGVPHAQKGMVQAFTVK